MAASQLNRLYRQCPFVCLTIQRIKASYNVGSPSHHRFQYKVMVQWLGWFGATPWLSKLLIYVIYQANKCDCPVEARHTSGAMWHAQWLSLVHWSSRIRRKNPTIAGGFEHIFMFPYVGNVIIPTDFHIFQRGGSTTNQITNLRQQSTHETTWWKTWDYRDYTADQHSRSGEPFDLGGLQVPWLQKWMEKWVKHTYSRSVGSFYIYLLFCYLISRLDFFLHRVRHQYQLWSVGESSQMLAGLDSLRPSQAPKNYVKLQLFATVCLAIEW